MTALVDGQLSENGLQLGVDAEQQSSSLDVDFAQLSLDTATDWKELVKVYKLQDTPYATAAQQHGSEPHTRHARAALERIVCSTVACKYAL